MTLRIAVPFAVLGLVACGGGGTTSPVSGTIPAAPASQHRAPVLAGATAAPTPNVTIHSGTSGVAINSLIIGTNMAGWVDITESGISKALADVGYRATRWPGGSESDQYHWRTNTSCAGGYTATPSTFDNFENDVAKPAKLDVAITLNYGSNAACNAGGDPTEAAAWVAHAKAAGDNVKYWTVGNEEYGSWEYDLHAKQHDPATYASAVATGYYPDVKAADGSAQVGVVVEANSAWDTTVLKYAKYDFVELHYYYTGPGQENDADLLANGAAGMTAQINVVKSELAAAGRAGTPIYLGEIGSVYTNPGKQSMSIVQGLYAGMILGELMKDGVFRSTWWLGFGGCNDASSGANFSSSLYGWQNFGGYMTLSDGTPEYGCSHATSVPLGTPFPTSRAFQLMPNFARTGERVASVTLGSGLTNLRAYGATHGPAYAVWIVNVSETQSYRVNIAGDGVPSGSQAYIQTYGKAQYDDSQRNVWTPYTTRLYGKWNGYVTETIPPWSMNLVVLYR